MVETQWHHIKPLININGLQLGMGLATVPVELLCDFHCCTLVAQSDLHHQHY